MTGKTLSNAQEYLITHNNGQLKRLVDIESLKRNHSDRDIITFLKGYLREKEKSLRNMILIDRTHHKVDEIAAAMFRITMAIKTLQDGKEVMEFERSKPRAKESCTVHKRNRRRNNRSWGWKDRSHDEKNRTAGHQTQRAA